MGTSDSKIPRPMDGSCKVVLEGYLLKRSIRKGKSGGWQKRYYRLYDIGVLDTFKRKSSTQLKRRVWFSTQDDCQITWDPMITSEVDYNSNEPPIFFLKNVETLSDTKTKTLNIHLKAETVAKRDLWIDSIKKVLQQKVLQEKKPPITRHDEPPRLLKENAKEDKTVADQSTTSDVAATKKEDGVSGATNTSSAS